MAISKKYQRIIGLSIFSIIPLILIISLVQFFIEKNLLRRDYRFTISHKISIGTTSFSGTKTKYTFMVNQKWYQGFTSLGIHRNGLKYFIKYYAENPSINEATNVIADSLDIKNLPLDGYRQLPHK